jgi:hypothetical protein
LAALICWSYSFLQIATISFRQPVGILSGESGTTVALKKAQGRRERSRYLQSANWFSEGSAASRHDELKFGANSVI